MTGTRLEPVIARPFDHRIQDTWRALRLLNGYRFLLGALWLSTFLLQPPRPFGDVLPILYGLVIVTYVGAAAAVTWALRQGRPSVLLQPPLQIAADIVAISLVMFASGGVNSGVGMLLIVVIAGGSVVLSRRATVAMAAAAALAELGLQTLGTYWLDFAPQFTQAGLLGSVYFATALLGHVLVRRVRESEELAQQRGMDLANMAQLNDYIIRRMQSGVLVIDEHNHIRLMNESAWYLLGTPINQYLRTLEAISPELFDFVQRWRADNEFTPAPFKAPKSEVKVLPRFARLGLGENKGMVIFLEDSALLTQQAQHLKLASLGRLTASIAHEIRNPLGAISHASQLLEESPTLQPADKRMTQIIREQAVRVNTIIESIMQLSRRDRTRPELFGLLRWLNAFVAEFSRAHGIEAGRLAVEIDPAETEVRMDPAHLHQVLSNLVHNALRHSPAAEGQPQVRLRGGIARELRGPFLDVIDNGKGIDPETATQIFEPFFSTDTQGTGLGLYIARELCESNQAALD
ncbi:MAG: ATP-binding protein, partial [Gammaproteobacteria bacterium]|nr:ATP-binding protein [Gammaproteobacteria bacterium]